MDDLNVAAVCMRAEPGRIEENLERIRTLSTEAAAGGADMACFPELAVTGYTLSEPEALCRGWGAQRLTQRLTDIARASNLVLLAGMLEPREDGPPYISQVVTGPEGRVGVHRKTHLSPMERGAFSAGDEVRVFTCRNTTFGVQLCYEAHFPEISTLMALKGAELLFFPHASPRGGGREKLDSWSRHLTGRAFDNGVFVVACNQSGDTGSGMSFPGAALVLGPDGREMAHARGEGILRARLPAKRLLHVRNHPMRYFLPWRRPDLYGPLAQSLRDAGGRPDSSPVTPAQRAEKRPHPPLFSALSDAEDDRF